MLQRIGITVGLVIAILIAAALVRGVSRLVIGGNKHDRSRFWIAQATHLLVLFGIIAVVVLEWAPVVGGFGAMAGWSAAGLTIALQRVVTAFAAYLIILRGKAFNVGDRIMIGGVRGDVVALGFMQTTVMEMGQTPNEQKDDPSMWVHARQYSGRIVRVTNDKIFDSPIYNYTRDFPFMWEEMRIPVRYQDDYRVVERFMLEIAREHTAETMQAAAASLEKVQDKYFLSQTPFVEPRCYLRLTDNWSELSVRFVVPTHNARAVKDAMSRDLLAKLNEAGIGIASGTYAIVEFPTVNVKTVS